MAEIIVEVKQGKQGAWWWTAMGDGNPVHIPATPTQKKHGKGKLTAAPTPGFKTEQDAINAAIYVLRGHDLRFVNAAGDAIRRVEGVTMQTALEFRKEGYADGKAVGVETGQKLGDFHGYRRGYIVGFTLAAAVVGAVSLVTFLLLGT